MNAVLEAKTLNFKVGYSNKDLSVGAVSVLKGRRT